MSKRSSGTVTIFLKIIGKTVCTYSDIIIIVSLCGVLQGDRDSQEMCLTHKQLLECIISSESKVQAHSSSSPITQYNIILCPSID